MPIVGGAAVAKNLSLLDSYARRSAENQQPCTSESLSNWFRGGPATTEPARKRRKLDRNVAASLGPVDQFDPGQSVLLASVSLDLELPGGLDLPNAADVLPTSIPVTFGSFRAVDDCEFFFSLSGAAFSHSLEITAVTDAELLTCISPHLTTIASFVAPDGSRKRADEHRPPIARCTLSAPALGQRTLKLELELRWRTGISVCDPPVNRVNMRVETQILLNYFPVEVGEDSAQWELSDFYDAVHVPDMNEEVSPRIREVLHETELYPFQRRAVTWLMRREGVAFTKSGKLCPIKDEDAERAPVSFKAVQDAAGTSCYVSHVRGLVVKDMNSSWDAARVLRGGILAEEMGLGKTVELLALISQHKRELPEEKKTRDPYLGTEVIASGATLIITPQSILEQWKQELQRHTPELKVCHYKGLPSVSASRKDHEEATIEHLLQFDVVLTTYNVLSKEIHHARPPPDRLFRREKVHKRRNSPLVEISWWRVCLDEAQMVESGVSQAATVARIIPRCNAWAVSGTPLRKDVQDLRGLLIFLRYEPYATSKLLWDRVDKRSFQGIFNEITLRHTKDRIRDELRLPPQKRVVITVPFTAVEEQNYAELMRQMCQACFLSPEGVPLREDKGLDDPEVIERMREWLVRLRQTCLHSHVGKKNRKALGGKVALRTVDEVLEVMIEQNDSNYKTEAREIVGAQLLLGHIQANAKAVERRSELALPYYQTALKTAQTYVKLSRDELAEEKEKLRVSQGSSLNATNDDKDDEDDEDDQSDKTSRVAVAQRNLRYFLELEHVCHFYIGSMQFQIRTNTELTKPGSEQFQRLEQLEAEAYDRAKAVRQELLHLPQRRVQGYIKQIKPNVPSSLHEIPELMDMGGIESRKVLEMVDTVTNLLNAQLEPLSVYRSKIVHILTLPLVDQDEKRDVTGDEYEDSTKVQDELYAYSMALRTLIADRNTAITGLQDLLIEHEFKDTLKVAQGKDDRRTTHAPELVLEFAKIREKLKPKESDGSLKGALSAARSLITTLQWKADGGDIRATTELGIAKQYLTRIQNIFTEQEKIIAELNKEQDVFRATMNQRLEFYRQLQHISDTVRPWREELDELVDVFERERVSGLLREKEKVLAGLKTKHAYLTNLRTENQQTGVNYDCIICQDSFEMGVLTSCGHKYCKDCINQWWIQHRTCPLCKQRLGINDFTEITLKPSEIKAQEEVREAGSPSNPSSPSSAGTPIYTGISDAMMREIKMIDLEGSFGTKVDMIARHLFWIRKNDPGAKSIIFSQFADFLSVLQGAYRRWGIGVASIRDKDGINLFKSDPAMECFLLDAKSDSSGLNLVNATYVFLCEPLINPAIELQAIARVHRIGQQRATTVFMYLVSNTVEEAIYDISVARRLEHMGRGTDSRSGSATPALAEKTLDAANSLELESAPLQQLLGKKGEGEVVLENDLWTCLFGKPRRDTRTPLEQRIDREMLAEVTQIRVDAEHVQAAAEHAAY